MNNSSAGFFCYPNLTREEIVTLERNRTKSLFGIYQLCYVYICFPLACLAFSLTLVYAISIKKAISSRRVSRKCYLFILNKVIGDLICCLFFVACAIYVLQSDPEKFSIKSFIVLGTMCGSCFWSGMVSYVSLCTLKLYAVWRPLHYNTIFTFKRCFFLIAFSWIFFLLWTLYAFERVSLVEALMRLRKNTSMYLISRSQDVFLIFLYLLTIIVFILTAVFMQKGKSFMDSLQVHEKGSKRQKRLPFWKLALGLITFVVLNSPYFLASIRDLFIFEPCFWQSHRDKKTIIMAAFRGFLLIRILIDAIVGFISDSQLRNCARSLITDRPSNTVSMKSPESSTNGCSFEISEKDKKVSKATCTTEISNQSRSNSYR